MNKVTITRYRKGQLSVPYLYCNFLDTLEGNLNLRYEGANRVIIDNARVTTAVHFKLGPSKDIEDATGSSILEGDGGGHIDGLGRIDVALTTPSDSHEVVCTPAELVNASQSGTIDEQDGSWTVGADDVLYMFLGRILDFKNVNGTVRIDSIIIHFNTDHNNCHFLSTYVHLLNRDSGGASVAVEDLVEHGEGGTGNDNGEIECNLTLVTNNAYRLLINIEATQGNMIIRAVTFKYHIV